MRVGVLIDNPTADVSARLNSRRVNASSRAKKIPDFAEVLPSARQVCHEYTVKDGKTNDNMHAPLKAETPLVKSNGNGNFSGYIST